MYREVLADGAFGELYVAGSRPERWSHVFASVQSLASYGVDRIEPDHFDIVVVNEFHHAEAPTYRRLLDHLRPAELLGLTATPERADGVDVRAFFGNRAAYELRLWDALAADLLVPFHYFGIADDVDLTGDRVETRPVRRLLARPDLHRQRRARRQGATGAPGQGERRPRHAGAWLLRVRRARRVHGRGLPSSGHPGAGRVGRHREHRPH